MYRFSSILIEALSFVFLAAVSASGTAAEESQKPNVVYILADDLGCGDLSRYGHTNFKTPNIDALAKRGMRFTQHYSGSAVCAPSRCSLLTGLHTGHAPVKGNSEHEPEGQMPMPASTYTIGHQMQSAGYETGVFGKWGPNKIHFNSENHFLSASWVRELDQPADYVRNVYWLATIQGLDANLAWWWARDPDGSPEDRMEGELNFFDPALAGSYAGSANQQPHVVNEVTQVMCDLNSFSEEVMAIRKQRRPVRMFYSETSAINKKSHMTDLLGLYESLFFEGFPLGYATEKIIKMQDHSDWDAIVVYKTEFVTDDEFAALQSYLDAGGTVVLDSNSLSKDQYGQQRKNSLAESNGKLVQLNRGAAVSEIKEATLKLVAGSAPGVLLTEDNGTEHKGCTWRVVDKLGGGTLMNILNLGKNTAGLKIAMQDGSPATATDMLTGQEIGSEFELKSNGVLLLEIK